MALATRLQVHEEKRVEELQQAEEDAEAARALAATQENDALVDEFGDLSAPDESVVSYDDSTTESMYASTPE